MTGDERRTNAGGAESRSPGASARNGPLLAAGRIVAPRTKGGAVIDGRRDIDSGAEGAAAGKTGKDDDEGGAGVAGRARVARIWEDVSKPSSRDVSAAIDARHWSATSTSMLSSSTRREPGGEVRLRGVRCTACTARAGRGSGCGAGRASGTSDVTRTRSSSVSSTTSLAVFLFGNGSNLVGFLSFSARRSFDA